MKAFIVLLIALFAFVAVSEARPLAFAAALTAGKVNQVGNDVGVAYAVVGDMKGNRQRTHVVGWFSNTANANVSAAWLASAAGDKFIQIPLASAAANNTLNGGRFFYVKTFLNSTHSALWSNSLFVNLYDSNGAVLIGGPLTSAPRTGIAQLTAGSVVPAQSNAFQGTGFFQLADPAVSTNNLVDLYNAYYSGFNIESAIVHDVTDATAASVYGNSNATTVGDVLTAVAGGAQYFYQTAATTNSDFYGIDYYANYFAVGTAATPAGVIRGNLIPVAKMTRSLTVKGWETQVGNITGGANAQTLKKANKWGDKVLRDQYILNLTSASNADSGGANLFVGTFTFSAPVGRKVNETLRGIKLETYFTASTNDLWEVSLLTRSNSYVVIGSYQSAATNFQYGETHWFNDASRFITANNEIVVRITANPAVGAYLSVDQLNLQAFVPNARAVRLVKTLAKAASAYTFSL
jgi:hypothetical protein